MGAAQIPTDDPAHGPAVDLPGMGELRDAAANRVLPKLPGFAALRRDALAGLSSAISNVPDAMANAVLVGVNPAYGLHAAIMGPAVGGLFSSTQLMVVTTTAAASLTAAQALGELEGEQRAGALFLMVALAGAFQILFGLLRFGRLTRFVSYSVTTGFLSGVSVLLILRQIPVVTGRAAVEADPGAQALELPLGLAPVGVASLLLAVLTLALAVLSSRTRLESVGRLAAVAVPSALAAALGLRGVQVVGDVGEIHRGVPLPALPPLSALSVDLVTGAMALAVVVLVQGSGVSHSVPNPDGSRRSMSRDFIAQGAANVASGLFRGLPVGGSISATALNVIYAAQSRWAVVSAGVLMALIVAALPGLVSRIAMPALGALLILAGVSSLKPRDIRAVWNAGWPSRLAAAGAFLATLLLPIQAAVAIGVLWSALLFVTRASTDVTLVELVKRPDGRIEERPPPKRLPPGKVCVFDVYGHLFYAGAHTLERLLPRPQAAGASAVVLRLRGLSLAGATLLDVIANYADDLEDAGGRLYLTGISKDVHDQVVRSGRLHLIPSVAVYDATPIRGESTEQAVADAKTWLVGVRAKRGKDDGG